MAVSTRVIDGPLRNALVCLDTNGNGACDADEAQGRTSADGTVTLQVAAEAAGRFPLLAVVGTDAVDADHGPVTTPFVLKAPADRAGLITPLTTLVQTQIENSGDSTAEAAEYVKSQAGLAVSPLQDFSGGAAAAAQAATLARLVVLTVQEQAQALQAGVVGRQDASGATATQADLARAVHDTVLAALPALAAAAADPDIASAADKDAALAAAARDAVANDLGLDPDRVLAAIGMAKLPADSDDTPLPSASLRGFMFINAANWFYRAMEGTAADNTPDASGLTHYYSVYALNSAGSLTTWGFHSNPTRKNDTHWNGSAWVSCPLGLRSSHTPRTTGRGSYDYCDKWELGKSVRSAVDISGQSLGNVVANKIRTFPGSLDGVDYAAWGPSNLALLGSAAFPAGSKLHYYRLTVTGTAPTYDTLASAVVSAFKATVAAGGDARSGTPACAAVTNSNAATFQVQPATLEGLVALNRGTPCVFGPSSSSNGTSLPVNEWWSNSTVSLGSVEGAMTLPEGTGGYYSTTALLRASFGDNGVATYYSCLQRSSDGSVRNCSVIGHGSYAIQTLGDARVMSFTGLPLLSQRMGWSRVFVERAGQIHLGYQNAVGTVYNQVRLNLPAANAVFAQLGMLPIVPQ